MKKIRQCLKENELFFEFIDKTTYGMMDWTKEKISINLDLLIVEVFLHEYIHWRNPDWSEKKVSKETDRRLNRMTIREMKKYCRYICKKGVLK